MKIANIIHTFCFLFNGAIVAYFLSDVPDVKEKYFEIDKCKNIFYYQVSAAALSAIICIMFLTKCVCCIFNENHQIKFGCLDMIIFAGIIGINSWGCKQYYNHTDCIKYYESDHSDLYTILEYQLYTFCINVFLYVSGFLFMLCKRKKISQK